ncbi:MAG TPA: ComEA family DNA-binding protein, partial [Beutenbergiaceae bacterium]|nr:ComEA family DNA-binding protein [Beutenbergiaceae bacterium]
DALNSDYEPGSVESTNKAPSTTTPAGEESVYVHVTGEVEDPGLVSLVEGDRVADAIDKAGGPTREAHVGGVNLAALVVDGEQIHVPHHDDPDPAPQSEPGGNQDSLIQINNATEQEFQELPGIGPVTAQRIVQYRTEHGGFSSVEDLQSVPGIGPATMAQIRDMVRL